VVDSARSTLGRLWTALVAALVVCAPVVAVAPAAAQGETRAQGEVAQGEAAAEAAAEAERLFHEGTRLLEEGRYESARVVFERALTLEPRASTAINLASALQALGRSWDAHLLLNRLEAGELGELDARFDEALAALRRAVSEGLARLELRVAAPRSVEVFIDDERAGELVTGSVLGRVLAPGTHTIRVEADGHRASVERVTLEPGQTLSRSISLEPRIAPEPAPHPPLVDGAEPLPEPASEPSGGVDVGLVVGLSVAAVVVLAAVGVLVGVVVADGSSCDAVIGCVEF